MQEKESSLSNISCSFIRLVWTHNTVSSLRVNWFSCTPVFMKFDFYLQHMSTAKKRLGSLFLRANSSWFCYNVYNFFAALWLLVLCKEPIFLTSTLQAYIRIFWLSTHTLAVPNECWESLWKVSTNSFMLFWHVVNDMYLTILLLSGLRHQQMS
jgi:hypothetical protein